ncbi:MULTISPECIES: ribosome hibernation-promoting factor, HPF/YfiA family [Bosea]|jgi:ribosomal subunit interface protein|uniref:ribosome hibernation-promoting factor, HPF/YfiA family n=1 Tax=Bosea TaxID=85413 RepID=UPI0021503F9A|nr:MULTISPECIES: ribosome-associated translation inhibitor RaiA [Bosea]MCR4522695.1 ribosome-associated translation inhibitor RaiA [Bosea sp. 47.2.35]MDR6826400.1 ribosomal subunit interface protein [Bosea robiniae]MDR6893110.1 ribosomal subunit interface protein [Bosea sp. BE109]MDR7137191.1 ribosomal subunit interface protein [Bosea sp. BE168]MDR7173891.1 ribosomal subunit interface protein [Bosea sp. BE271]
MSLRISGKNLDVGEALRGQAEERVAAAVSKYYEGGYQGHVTVDKDGTAFRTDGVLHLSSGITLEASATAHDPYASLDKMAERIEKRLRRYKRRLKDRSSANGRDAGIEIPSYVIAAPDDDIEDFDGASAGDNPVIVAESTKSLHVRTVSDAVAELDLTGAPVVVFRHAGNGRMNIVYRRGDGNIGWIDPPASLS